MKKLLTTLLVVLISVIGLANVVTATDFSFQEIEVNGVDVLGTTDTIHVERGENVDILVEFTSDSEDDNVRVKAWIGGFEYGDVVDRSDIFSVEPGVVYVERLNLEIPEDIEIEDSYTLHVEVFDDDDVSREETFGLTVRKERHELNILDVIFYPSNTVEAGRALRTVVRVENLGEKKEEDVLVKVSIPELGLSTKAYIDELVSDEPTSDDDEETSESSDELILFIPKDAESGEYLVEVEVEFNRGHDTVTEKRTILVEGVEDAVTEAKAIISVDMTTQNIGQGQEVPYKFMLANLGNQKVLYSIEVEGTGAWGMNRVSPAFVSVDQGEAGEFFVFVKANENAPVGSQSFKVNVLADGNEVKELNLQANIVESKAAKGIAFENVQTGLEIGFIILVIVLVILGLVIAFRRVGEKPRGYSRSDEPETVDNQQTYY